MSYRIVPAEIGHVYALASRLRELDQAEIRGAGNHPAIGLRKCFYRSIMRKTVFVDGEIAAMWGVGGMLLDCVGTPWFLTGPAIERIPVALVKEGRREIRAMLGVYPVLCNYVLASYGGAVRFLEVLGFTLGEAEPMGPLGVPFRRFEMRAR